MPAVFVHGVPDTQRVWRALITRLRRDDVVTLSLPGFGCEIPTGFDCSKEAYCDWLLRELDNIDRPIDLVAHDWGAILALRVTSLEPTLVRTWAVGEDEILVEVRVPVLPASTGAAYLKFPHPASRFAVVGVAAAVTLDSKGVCSKASVGITGAGTKAVRAKGVEAGCNGKKLDAAAIEAAAQKAAEGVDVQADLQGSVEYKSHLCRVFAKRALTEAVKRAGG